MKKELYEYFLPLYHLRSLISDKIFLLKMAWQRAYRGYDDVSVWNLDDFLAKGAYTRLNVLSKLSCFGYPQEILDKCNDNEDDALSMWHGFVSDMIYFLKYADSEGLDTWMKERSYTDNQRIATWRAVGTNPVKALCRLDKRFKKGRYYFFKYFYSLWD